MRYNSLIDFRNKDLHLRGLDPGQRWGRGLRSGRLIQPRLVAPFVLGCFDFDGGVVLMVSIRFACVARRTRGVQTGSHQKNIDMERFTLSQSQGADEVGKERSAICWNLCQGRLVRLSLKSEDEGMGFMVIDDFQRDVGLCNSGGLGVLCVR